MLYPFSVNSKCVFKNVSFPSIPCPLVSAAAWRDTNRICAALILNLTHSLWNINLLDKKEQVHWYNHGLHIWPGKPDTSILIGYVWEPRVSLVTCHLFLVTCHSLSSHCPSLLNVDDVRTSASLWRGGLQCAVQRTLQCQVNSSVLRNAVQCSVVQQNAVQCSAVECSAVQCSLMQHSAVQCSAVQWSVVPRDVEGAQAQGCAPGQYLRESNVVF